MDGFVERMAAVENEMKKLTNIAVVLARYDERILAVTMRLNLMDKRWEELRHDRMDGISSGRICTVESLIARSTFAIALYPRGARLSTMPTSTNNQRIQRN